ncbi:hypothetical protein [Paracoccus salsus]|uniref:hypothetical protein n=1 Tax=Paracoccus salsus TaxID=2911061 RepID=UPI001F36E49D|nr:hypothetical protein [Paracoccus salsus]MCF3972334.1 hypothetical protein [Paracoccus salsus]
MNTILTLLVASTALTAAIGVAARSARMAPAGGGLPPFAALFQEGSHAMLLALARDDDDRGWREGARRGHDGDDDCRGGARNPVPAGTAAPPQNGHFGHGAPPQVQVN